MAKQHPEDICSCGDYRRDHAGGNGGCIFTDDKWVRIMCDFCADGVWNRDGASISAEDVPISEALKARLAAWQEWYGRDCQDYMPPEERERHLDRKAFSAEGLKIARAIKSELLDWTIIYFDDEAANASTNKHDRSTFEYEIDST